MQRRTFLLAAPAAMRAAASDRLRVAVAGLNGRGNAQIRALLRRSDVDIAALCDVDESVLRKRVQEVETAGRKPPQALVDFRKLIEDKEIDAVVLATPNHHHTLQTIWACQAGKDVYVEKPCSHNIFEARQIVAAARRYGRIVQHGTQARSSPGIRDAIDRMRGGLLGDLYMARGLCFKWRNTIGRAQPEPVPPGVHYDLWTGPAPLHAFTRNRFHYNWHWFWDYGNGDIGNQGAHQMDVARWGLGVRYPTLISATGGHFLFDDDQETPNTMAASFEFADGGRKKLLVFEVRHWIVNHESFIGINQRKKDPNTIGNLFFGSKGYLAIDRGAVRAFLGKEQEPYELPRLEAGGDDAHFGNFFDAVRSRKAALLSAEIEEGAVSATLVHLANISYRLQRTLRFDPATLRCLGDEEANAMFTRVYRAPFVVPEKV